MLKENAELRAEYTQLRENLLNDASTASSNYEEAKNAFIKKTLA